MSADPPLDERAQRQYLPAAVGADVVQREPRDRRAHALALEPIVHLGAGVKTTSWSGSWYSAKPASSSPTYASQRFLAGSWDVYGGHIPNLPSGALPDESQPLLGASRQGRRPFAAGTDGVSRGRPRGRRGEPGHRSLSPTQVTRSLRRPHKRRAGWTRLGHSSSNDAVNDGSSGPE